AGGGLRLQKRRLVGLGVDVGVGLVALGVGLFNAALQILPGAIELRLEEAKSPDALAFGKQRVEPALDSVVGDDGSQRERLRAAHEITLNGEGIDERRIRLLRYLGKAIVEHRAEKLLDQILSIGLFCRVEAFRLLVEQ